MSQLDLEFSSRKTPEVSQDQIDLLTSFLAGKGWVKACSIDAELDLDERDIRAIAEASDGLIISGPGCPGYKLLTGAAEIADVDRAACRLESQAKRMLHRANSLRRRAHSMIR